MQRTDSVADCGVLSKLKRGGCTSQCLCLCIGTRCQLLLLLLLLCTIAIATQTQTQCTKVRQLPR